MTGPATPPTPGVRADITAENRAVALRRVNRRGGRMWTFAFEWIKSFVIAIALFLVVRACLVEAFKIPSGSMERTLLVGDFLLVNKLAYGAEVPFIGAHLPPVRDLQRGDVVVFQWPVDLTKNFVKRVVGLPGDTLAMRSGVLVLNGRLQDEAYVSHTDPGADPADQDFRWQRKFLVPTVEAAVGSHPSRNNWGPLVVPGGHFFVLGDNRDNSLDSRYWGFVPDSLLRGRPMFVYFSYVPDSASTVDWLTHIRWNRLGDRIR
jgi:signal peptidase I